MKKNNFIFILILTLLISLASKYLASINMLKLMGHLVIALIIGMIIQFPLKKQIECSHNEISFISNKFLRAGIILLGFKLNISVLLESGIKSILIAAIIVCFTISVSYFILHKVFKIEHGLAMLTASGCGICGAAAIMGISKTLNSKKEDTILSVAVVCILGTVFTLIFVYLKDFINLSDTQYSVFVGSSLHEIAHAVAAGSVSKDSDAAIIAKLARVLLLAPSAIILGYIEHRKNKNSGENTSIALPYFMIGFVLTSLIGSYANISANILNKFVDIAYILLAMAMCSLGLNVNFTIIKQKGIKLLFGGFICSCLIIPVSYTLAYNLF